MARMPTHTLAAETAECHKLLPTKRTVLVVDDDLSVRRALQLQLRLAGFKVRVFDSAEALLSANFPTDNTCLLLDLYMPGMGGIELLRILATAGRQIPTVLMSGRDDETTRKLARQANGNHCLFKPFDQSALLRTIRKAMHREVKADRQACKPRS
jgi:two-component system response regulator FixJ